MDTITQNALVAAGEAISALDPAQTGDVHTITLTLDGRTGMCQVTVESTLHSDVVMQVG